MTHFGSKASGELITIVVLWYNLVLTLEMIVGQIIHVACRLFHHFMFERLFGPYLHH